jgi:hypothetical protein
MGRIPVIWLGEEIHKQTVVVIIYASIPEDESPIHSITVGMIGRVRCRVNLRL